MLIQERSSSAAAALDGMENRSTYTLSRHQRDSYRAEVDIEGEWALACSP